MSAAILELAKEITEARDSEIPNKLLKIRGLLAKIIFSFFLVPNIFTNDTYLTSNLKYRNTTKR
jgi:hypothetical protein